MAVYFTNLGFASLFSDAVSSSGSNFSSSYKSASKKFDRQIQAAATNARVSGVSFVYWNNDHVEVFDLTQFVPLWDEEDGTLKAGIRYWQIDADKPMRITLYTLDGVTEYIKRKDADMTLYAETRPYVILKRKSELGGERVVGAANYESFPIVPLWNNKHQSDLVGNRGTIDAYDLMTSGLINNVSEGEVIYWVLKNCGGMDALDDAKFLQQLRTSRVVHADGDEGSGVDAHTVNVPFEASAEALDRLTDQLFHDFMALRVEKLSAGAVTNDQIQAAYEPLNQKVDEFEYNVTDCIESILALAGITDAPTYTRSQMSNRKEIIDAVLSSVEHLSDSYVTEKILTALGDGDRMEKVEEEKIAEAAGRVTDTTLDDDDLFDGGVSE
jgi:hypothetical protein